MESKNIIQMFDRLQIIDVSKARNCWKDEELKDIGITYHNVCEIYEQLQPQQPEAKDKENNKKEEENNKISIKYIE